jgi:hypothetical protein
MSTNTFLAVVGTILVLLIGMLTLQKLAECRLYGGVACCFGRFCPAHATGSPASAAMTRAVKAKNALALRR